MRELSVPKQRYGTAQALLAEGRTVTEVAAKWRESRQTMDTWSQLFDLAFDHICRQKGIAESGGHANLVSVERLRSWRADAVRGRVQVG